MLELSKRLKAIASFVHPGSRVADIGTDHGFLPIYLVECGIAGHAVAMDVRKGPLARAEEHIREAGLEKQIETRLSDGLEKLKAGEADTVVIAGMGGPLILEILERGMAAAPSVKQFILSPQSDWNGFRKGLRRLGFALCREQMLSEDGKYYLIAETRYSPADRGYVIRETRNAGREISGGMERRADRGHVIREARNAGREMSDGMERRADREHVICETNSTGREIIDGKKNDADRETSAGLRELQDRFGPFLLEEKSPVLLEYLKWQRGILTGILHKLTESDTADAGKRRAEVKTDLEMVEAALAMFFGEAGGNK